MKQDNMNLINLIELLKNKLILFESLKITTQNSLIALENLIINEFCALLDESESYINKINEIDENFNDVISSLNRTSYMEVKEIYTLFKLKEAPLDFKETKFSEKYEDLYNMLYKQYFLLIDLLRLNEDLKKRLNSETLTIVNNLKDINAKKQKNLKYIKYNYNNNTN